MGDGDHPFGHRAHPVAHFLLETARFPCDLFHGPGQHPCAVVQQAAVGRIVDVAFHHRGVHPQLASLNHMALLRQAHDPVVQFADGLGPNRLPQTKQRLFIRHFRQANPAETPVHHVGAYFPLYNLVTPIAHVLQDQHAQRYFRWRLPSPARAAPPMPFPLAPGRRLPTVRRPPTIDPPPASTVPTTRLLPRQTILPTNSAAGAAIGSLAFLPTLVNSTAQSNVVARTLTPAAANLLLNSDYFYTGK